MELLKIIYFLLLIIFAAKSIIAKKMKLDWIVILTAVTIHSFYFFGWHGILFITATGLITTVVELLSLKTPLNVFGVSYKYHLQNRIFPSGLVLGKVLPIEVTAAWILFKYLSFFISLIILTSLNISGVWLAMLSALTLVSFDLILDPYAVSEGAWQWSKPGRFFQIPWQNFLGWFLVGLITSVLFMSMEIVKINDVAMIAPVFLVTILFPMMLGRKLFSINRTQATLALLPLSSTILIGLYLLVN